ncbi:LuxR C-terminal-related transcriptional regulator [Streptomyces sp. NPDC005227]|uniref:LuxR C-terminal-related transcriptional regulator n=1 Tax=Streptomyces sp. NPDC005227 TaxID=3364707 RepID=UPI0036A25BA0
MSDQGGPVGRIWELGRIDAFARVACVAGGTLMVTGPTGIGKTLLLDSAVDRATRSDDVVLTASGAEFEADVGFSTLSQLLYPLHAQMSTLAEDHSDDLSLALGYSSSKGKGSRVSVSEAAIELLAKVRVASPILLAVDDLQWVDSGSAVVLREIADVAPAMGIGFIGACRTDTGTRFDASGFPQLELSPLKPAESALLVTSCFPQLSPQAVQRVVAESEGYPLALVELASALSENVDAGGALPQTLPLSQRLQDLFTSRVNALPDSTRRALLLRALASGQASGLGAELGAPEELALAEAARLISARDTRGSASFRHPLIRAAVVHCSTSAERRRAHAELAGLFAHHPERCAWHLAQAADQPDAAIATLLEAAATAALRRGDSAGAVSSALRSAKLSPDAAERCRRLARAAYIEADVSGALQDASDLLAAARQASSGSDGSLQGTVAAAYVLLNEGDVDTAHALLTTALTSGDPCVGASRETLVSALHTLMLAAFFGGRPELWQSFEQGLALLQNEIPPALACMANTFPDPVRTGHAALDQVEPILDSLANEEDPARIVFVSEAVFYLDRLEACRNALWRVVHNGREGGAVASSIYAVIMLSFADFANGSWDTAQQLADEGVQLCEKHGYRLLAWPGRLAQALIAAARGDLSVTTHIARSMTNWSTSRGGRTVHIYAHHARELAALGYGDFDEAYRLATAISPPGLLPPYTAHALWVPMDLVEAAVHIGRHAEACAHVRALKEADVAALSPRLAQLVAGSEAMAATDPDDAIELYEQALALPGGEQWPFERARIQASYGQRLRRLQRTLTSRDHLHAAATTFDELGAQPWRSRVLRELEATGLNKGRTTTGRDALTPREEEIASLAATGLGNKQIAARLLVSPRTVAAHLRHIFPKLGVSSRAALRDSLGAPPPQERGGDAR